MTPAAGANIRREMRGAAAKLVQENLENQALHLRTYEAAIESMLRKMDAQGMGGRLFSGFTGLPWPLT